MDKLEKALQKQFGKDNVWQCEETPLVNRYQIVIELKPSIIDKIVTNHRRDDVIKCVRKILSIYKQYHTNLDLRVAIKLPNNITVSGMIFSYQAILSYDDKQDLEQIAEDYHIASGLK